MQNILKRIERLKNIAPNRLRILVNDNGVEKVFDVKQFKESPHVDFIRIISGNNLQEFDELLDLIPEKNGITKENEQC